jgi:hypothetical protein
MQTDPDTQAPVVAPATQSIAETKDLMAFAHQFLEALRRGGQRLEAEVTALEDQKAERAWLASAALRIGARLVDVEQALARAGQLPEFESDRRAQAEAVFAAWVDTAEGLLIGISSHASPNNPLVEVLFPHQKFEKVRRGGTAARAYMAEVVRRRRLSYVLRLSAEPEYEFLVPLLARFDEAKLELERREEPVTLGEDELTSLRHAIFFAADALRSVLQQARLLAEAALTACPGSFTELGLDAKPRKRAVRSVSSAPEPA